MRLFLDLSKAAAIGRTSDPMWKPHTAPTGISEYGPDPTSGMMRKVTQAASYLSAKKQAKKEGASTVPMTSAQIKYQGGEKKPVIVAGAHEGSTVKLPEGKPKFSAGEAKLLHDGGVKPGEVSNIKAIKAMIEKAGENPAPPIAPAAPKPAAVAKPSTPSGGSVGGAIGALGSNVVGRVSGMARSVTTKGLEQVKKPQGVKEFEAGEPNEGPAPHILEVNNKEKPVSKSAEATAILLMDSMIKACDKKGVRLVPDVGMEKAEVIDPKKKSPKGADRPPGALATAAPAKPVKNPGVPGSGSHFNFAIDKAGDVKKDMEHLTGEQKKLAPPSPAAQKQATSMFGPSASQQGPAAKQQAVASAGPGSPATKQALASIKPAAAPKTTGGATGAVSGAPAGVFTSAPAQPAAAPAAAPAAPKKVASMSKSAEATEILKGMIAKASTAHSPANPANEPGSVSGTPHGGIGPGATTCSITDEESHGGKGEAQSSVSGAAHAGSGPAQQFVGGTPHGGSGPAQTNVSGTPSPGNEGTMNKALQAGSIPRMPRAMAMAMDDWRSATNVMTRGNSRFAKHAGAGPLNGEVLAEVEERVAERTTNFRDGVLKACGGCGRTFTLRKSDDSCPTCSARDGQMMAKSRGGMLIPAGF